MSERDSGKQSLLCEVVTIQSAKLTNMVENVSCKWLDYLYKAIKKKQKQKPTRLASAGSTVSKVKTFSAPTDGMWGTCPAN